MSETKSDDRPVVIPFPVALMPLVERLRELARAQAQLQQQINADAMLLRQLTEVAGVDLTGYALRALDVGFERETGATQS